MATKADDEAQILRLDNEWNEAYRRQDRAPLVHILADDFTGLTTASGEPITASLTTNRPERARSVIFSEQSVHVFGDTAISKDVSNWRSALSRKANRHHQTVWAPT